MCALSFYLLLVFVLIKVSSGTSRVIGLVGQNITLPCWYNVHAHGVLSICWGRGNVPTSKCSDTILSSQGEVVVFRESPRYQLLGSVHGGDVSLTIVNAQNHDAGVYGCRVEIPGWFNDLKTNTRLVIKEAEEENEPVTQNNMMFSDFTEEENITHTDRLNETAEILIQRATLQEKDSTSFLEVWQIGRFAAAFILPVVLAIVLIIRKRIQLRVASHHRDPETNENIYESIQMTT